MIILLLWLFCTATNANSTDPVITWGLLKATLQDAAAKVKTTTDQAKANARSLKKRTEEAVGAAKAAKDLLPDAVRAIPYQVKTAFS